MKLGSLFDGSGTAPLAAAMCGIEPVWASEIEPYPIKVTKARFPNMKHLGSILDINGAEVEPVDIICGGSPCQDLSVAGKQKGLHEGERSHLFFEMTRIIKEMRNATNGKYPRYVIWENVPGAFSSNNGRDFLAVLQAFAEIADPDIHVPEPKQKAHKSGFAWKYAGYVAGDGWSIAWRTVDAQYWGVPQRRRRIYLVADFAGERADEILFECKSVSGNPQPSGTQREEAAGTVGGSTEGGCGIPILNDQGGQVRSVTEGVTGTLRAQEHGHQPIVAMRNGYGAISINRKQFGLDIGYDIASTILANDFKEPQCIIAGFVGRQGAKSGSVGFENDISPTLRQGITTDVVYTIEGNTIDRESNKNGKGYAEDVSLTLNTQDRHGCCYAADIRNGALNEELSGTLQSKNGGGYSLNYQNPVVYPFDMQAFGKYGNGETASTLKQRDYKDTTDLVVEDCRIYPGVGITSKQNSSNPMPGDPAPTLSTDSRNYLEKDGKPPRKYIVRRLTPLECCRLQGFPDWWTEGCEEYPITQQQRDTEMLSYIEPHGKIEGSDSAKYKMWGNGMALPNMLHVMVGISRAESRRADI